MMIRSVPPASAHFAERPVPAPAPMIGCLRCDLRLAAGASASARRHRRALGSARRSRSAIARRERRVVDVRRRARAPRPSAPSVSSSAPKQRRVGLRVVERLALGRRSRETPLSGHEHASARSRGVSFRADPPAERAHSSGVVRISVTVALWTYRLRSRNRSGTVSSGPKFTMSSAPSETTCGMPGRAGRLEPVRPGREHPADQLVGQLGRRHVEHAGEVAVVERAPPSPGRRSRRVEDEHLVAELLEPLARARSRRRRHAEHRGGDERLARCRAGGAAGLAMPAIAAAALP